MSELPLSTSQEERELLERAKTVTADLTELAAGLTSDLRNSTVEGPQTFSLEQAQHELKAEKTAADLRIKEHEAAHRIQQQREDNNLRRITFKIVLGVFIGVLALAFIAAVWSDNAPTRSWAQGIVTTIMGGIAGGVVGYFTGKTSK